MRGRQLIVAVVLTLAWISATGAQSLGKGMVVTGKVPIASVRKVVDAGVKQLSRCFDDLKKASPEARGRLEISFDLDTKGKAKGLRLIGAPALTNAAFEKCVGEVVTAWKLPRPESGTAKIVLPVLFGVNEPTVEPGEAEPAEPANDASTRGATTPAQDDKEAARSALPARREDRVASSVATDHAAAANHAPSGTPAKHEAEAKGRGNSAAASAASPPAVPKAAPDELSPKPGVKKDRPGDAKEKSPDTDGALAAAPALAGSVDKTTSATRPAGTPPRAEIATKRAVAAPAMKAGRYDDNKQYNRFVDFMSENRRLAVYPVDISERLLIDVLDKNGKSLPNCGVEVSSLTGEVLSSTTTYADGTTQFFPAASSPKTALDYVFAARCGQDVRKSQLSRTGRRVSEVRFETPRTLPARVPVDVAIVLDTTGSMQGQIDRLKTTLQAIHFQLTSLPTKPDIRFGLVAYRDHGDDYITKVWRFTDQVDDFQKVLNSLSADGGGDTPEDMQAGLEVAMHQLEWRKDALRIGFVISDAVPHTDYGETYNYREVMRESLTRGIKWVTVGAGGLGRDGEVIYRQIAQFSMGEYVFITEGAQGDAEGGAGEASHHVGTNYLVENLDQAIIRIVRRELSYLTDSPKEVDETIAASGAKGTPRDEVLAPAVAEAVRQLIDYSSMQLPAKTPLCVVPVTAEASYKDVAGYLGDQFALVTSRAPTFKLVERDLQALAAEQKLQLSDLFDVTETVPIGKLIGAEVMIVAKLATRGDEAQLFAKLIRVETGEVLSIAKVRITGGVI